MKIKEFIEFDKKKIFNGAIQLEWCYDEEFKKEVSESFVFHGAKYHGIDKSEIANKDYELIDSANFFREINRKLYIDSESDRLMLAIAGYGTGKSHLGVTMATLFSEGKDSEISKQIIKNIEIADEEIGNEIRTTINGKNLVLAINGSTEANLNYLVLNAARKGMEDLGLDTSILDKASKAKEVAKTFLENNFERYEKELMKEIFDKKNIKLEGELLKEYLVENLESDNSVFEIINENFNRCNGTYIIKKDTSSAKAILDLLKDELVDKGIVNKIFIIFDEFGRYIEFAAESPSLAGDSALQHIVESIQNAKGNILFLGLIQSDIETYMARTEIKGSSNIDKYLARYKHAEKYYLSSNLETIFANLLKKTDENKMKVYVENPIEYGLSNVLVKNHNKYKRWFSKFESKNVWKNYDLYEQVILKGTYPFNPLSIWILSNLSSWMQERSTIVYLGEAFNRSDIDIDINNIQLKGLPYINPIEIINDNFINELKTSEERGLQKSNLCTKYLDIINEHKRNLNDVEEKIFKSILISNILGAKLNGKEDFQDLISMLTGYSIDQSIKGLKNLEEDEGIIYFDSPNNRYEFIEAKNGRRDYTRTVAIKTLTTRNSDVVNIINNDNELKNQMNLKDVEDKIYYAKIEHISSDEWRYKIDFYDAKNINKEYVEYLKKSCDLCEYNLRGRLVYVYANTDEEIKRLIGVIKEADITAYPIVFQCILDREKIIYEAGKQYGVLNSLSSKEKENFKIFYEKDKKSFVRDIAKEFIKAKNEALIITEEGIIKKNIKEYCESIFRKCYSKIIPFEFDGFEKKNITRAKSAVEIICKNLINGNFKDKNKIMETDSEIKNKIDGVFSNNRLTSWKCMREDGQITHSNNPKIIEIVDEIDEKLKNEEILFGNKVFGEFLRKPYGLNEYSLSIFIAYYIFINRKKIKLYDGKNERVQLGLVEIKTKGKGFKQLLEYKYQLSVLNEEESLLEKLEIVNKSNRINECIRYEEEINILSKLVEKNESLLNKLEIYEIRLERAKDLELNLKGLRETIEKNEMNDKDRGYVAIVKAVINLNAIKKVEEEFKKSKMFNIPDEYQDIIDNKMIMVSNVLINGLDDQLKNLNIPNDEKKDQRIKQIKIVEKTLKEYEYIQSSNKVNKRLNEIEKEIKEREKNEKIINEIKYILKKIDLEKEKNINELIVYEEEIIKAKIAIQKSTFLADLNIELAEKLEDIKKKILNLENSYEIELQKIDKISDIRELNIYANEINKIKENVKNTSTKEQCISYIAKINRLKKELEVLNTENREELNKRKVEIEGEFEDNKGFLEIVSEFYSKQKEILDKKELIWKENNFFDENINRKKSIALNRRKEDLERYPKYLSNESIEEIKIRLKNIDELLKECKIEGIVNLFNELTDAEKKECLKRINNM